MGLPGDRRWSGHGRVDLGSGLDRGALAGPSGSGVGRALYEAITARDYPIVQAFTLVIALTYVIVNMLVDISYTFLDPRVRLNK